MWFTYYFQKKIGCWLFKFYFQCFFRLNQALSDCIKAISLCIMTVCSVFQCFQRSKVRKKKQKNLPSLPVANEEIQLNEELKPSLDLFQSIVFQTSLITNLSALIKKTEVRVWVFWIRSSSPFPTIWLGPDVRGDFATELIDINLSKYMGGWNLFESGGLMGRWYESSTNY